MLTDDQRHQVANWHPRTIYTWTKAMLQAWFDSHGSFALYDGAMWEPKARSLGVGRYEVRFAPYAVPADTHARRFVDVVFDGPPGHDAGRFVEVEDEQGKSVAAGKWIDRGNGLWALRIEVAS